MFKLSKKSAVELVLSKRFGTSNPSEIDELSEVNVVYSADEQISEFGICVELKFEEANDENYQVNANGVVYSWGDSPIIDERSRYTKLSLESVYQNQENDDSDDPDADEV